MSTADDLAQKVAQQKAETANTQARLAAEKANDRKRKEQQRHQADVLKSNRKNQLNEWYVSHGWKAY